MDSITHFLNSISELFAWQTEQTTVHSSEIYLVHDKTEALRSSQVTRYDVHVFRKTKNEKMGESHAQFDGLPPDWTDLIQDAVTACTYLQNPVYEPSEPWKAEQNDFLYDPSMEENKDELLHKTEETVRRFQEKYKSKVYLSYLEAHIKTERIHKTNSKGLDLALPKTSVLYDFSLLSADQNHEITAFIKRNFYRDLPLFSQLESEAQYLDDLSRAVLPPTGSFPVVMADEALDTLFDFHIFQVTGEAVYQNVSMFETGKRIAEQDPLEPFTLSSNPFLKGAKGSGLWDSLGFPLKKLDLIQEGFVKEYAIDGKYAQILGRYITSDLSNPVIECGQTPYENFLQDGVLELLRFSTFSPDPVSGNFSGEIRLGYYYKNGKKIPVRQGSVSGNIRTGITRCRFAKERVQRESYNGPAGVYFENLTIAGDI